MTRSERLLALLQALRGRRTPVTARELAKLFSVSERTVYRDIVTLSQRGAVIDGEAGLGYLLRSDYFMPPLALDADESAAVMLGLRFVERRADDGLAAAAASARRKLAAASPASFDEAAAQKSPLLVAPPASPQARMLGVVRDALARERKLQLSYADAAGRTSGRLVWPVALGWFDEIEMLAAWCETRQAFRNFRVDRIATAQVVDERPPRPRYRLLAEYKALEPGIAL